MNRFNPSLALHPALSAWLLLAATFSDFGGREPPPASQPQQVDRIPSRLTWDQCMSISELIADLPAWSNRSLDKSEWQKIADLTCALQQLSAGDVEDVFVVYMVLATSGRFGEDPLPNWTKPMLLLRVMFDVPEGVAIDNEDDSRFVGPFGGFSHKELPEGQSDDALWLPIAWDDKGPRLLGEPAYREFVPSRPYQPQLEYRYFVAHFPLRGDFGNEIQPSQRSWIDLRMEQRERTED